MAKTYDEIRIGVNTFAGTTKILDTIGKIGLEQAPEAGLKVLGQTMIPAISLKAFSCELALKALIAKSGKEVTRDHELDKLYGMLDTVDKNAISQAVIQTIKKQNKAYDEAKFFVDLSQAAKTFVEWRYFYEEGVTADLGFINALFEELLKYIGL